jgi:hypothetical protein
VGIVASVRRRDCSRRHVFLGIVGLSWVLALLRLYVTGGYCTPRHAMLLAVPLFAFAAGGLLAIVDRAAGWIRRRSESVVHAGWPRPQLEGVFLAIAILAILAVSGRSILAPVNGGYSSYRPAGEWLAANTPADARILDLKGWASFYGGRRGYTFGEIEDALHDPSLRWVVAHDAFLIGPWSYCDIIRGAVAGRACVKSFPETPTRGVAQVHIFDRSIPLIAGPKAENSPSRREASTIR